MLNLSRETNVRFLREAARHMQEKILLLEKRLAEAEKLAIAEEERFRLSFCFSRKSSLLEVARGRTMASNLKSVIEKTLCTTVHL